MKKNILLIVLILTILAIFVACDKTTTYTIKFDSNEGSEVPDLTINEDTTIDTIQEPTKTGYVFDGWYFDNESFTTKLTDTTLSSQENKDITVYAKWSLKKYTVEFNGNGGKCIEGCDVQKIEFGKEPSYPTFLKIGYTFTGWDKEISSVNSDISINATYRPNKYVITLDNQGGNEYIANCNANYNQELPNLEIPSKTNCNFGGFYTEPKGEGTQYYDSLMKGVKKWDTPKDTTLYAKWYQKVTFDKQQGSGGSDYAEAVIDEPMPKAQAPKLDFHSFMGYYTEENGNGVQYYDKDMNSLINWNNNQPITLYAYWVEAEYNITFDKQGGYFGSDFVTIKYGENMPSAEKPQKCGFNFTGYYLNKDNNEIQYYDENMNSVSTWNIDDNLELYAKWEALETTTGFSFTLINDGKEYEITGFNGDDTTIIIPQKYDEIPIVSIANEAFANTYLIEKVSMPTTIINIGEKAFYECLKLEIVEMPPYIETLGNQAFGGCLCLEEIKLPDTLKIIPSECFANCKNLSKIDFGNNLTKIEDGAFSECTALNNVVLPDSLQYISNNVFSNCLYLDNIQLSSNLLTIGNNAFDSCKSLNNIELPNTLLNIGEYAFNYCNIYNYDIPENVVYIGNSALYLAHNIFIHNKKPCSIGEQIFNSNSYVFVPNDTIDLYKITNGWEDIINLYTYDDIDENGFLINSNNTLLTYTKDQLDIIIPSKVLFISDYAFQGKTGKISFVENSPVETIFGNTFSYYEGTEIELASNITSVDGMAFDNCVNLETLTIGENCLNVGKNAFTKNINLKDIYIYANNPPFGECDYNYTTINLYVPESSFDIYATDPFWRRFNVQVLPD